MWFRGREGPFGPPLPFFFNFYLHLCVCDLFSSHTFLFLQFLLGCLFLLCSLLSGSGVKFFFNKDHLHVAGRAHIWVDLTMSSVRPASILGALFTGVCSVTRESTSPPSSLALLSAFLSMCSKNSALFAPPTLSPAPLFGYQFHHCNDWMARVASVKGHPSDTW